MSQEGFDAFSDYTAVLSQPLFVLAVETIADYFYSGINVLIDSEESIGLLDLVIGAVDHRLDAFKVIKTVKERWFEKVGYTSGGDTIEIISFREIDDAFGSEIDLGQERHVFIDDTVDEACIAD